jgi:hypothetical protein
VRGWERFFSVSSETWLRRGQPVVGGYVVNETGHPASRVQLLVEALDGSGRVVDHRVTWLGPDVSPGSRAYYQIRAPQGGATYRVSVFAFDWRQTASIQAP